MTTPTPRERAEALAGGPNICRCIKEYGKPYSDPKCRPTPTAYRCEAAVERLEAAFIACAADAVRAERERAMPDNPQRAMPDNPLWSPTRTFPNDD